ncbi:MAG TPA: AMP-binding protein [Steroidobacteraceae bacterium]|nr:AMP-binding protein [Steroidobacteraceae bacterium]
MAPLDEVASVPERDAISPIVEDAVRTLFEELHHAAAPGALDPQSRLDADLGFDSLARVELLERLERALNVELPTNALESIDTVSDLTAMMRRAPSAAGKAAGDRFARTLAPRAPEPAAAQGEPVEAKSLTEVLMWRAQRQPQTIHAIVLGEPEPVLLTNAGLLEGAQLVAAGLAARGLSVGAVVALMLPTSVEYLHAFFGVLLAGGIPVPLYPPSHRAQLQEHIERHVGILGNAGAEALITFPAAQPLARRLRAKVRGLRQVLCIADFTQPATAFPSPTPPSTDSIALLQYTSGSTGSPKGVVLTHAHLLANIRAMGKAIGASGRDVFVSWLPLYHDMGLIGAWLGSLYFACRLILMPPTAFLARPARWLKAIHEHRGTLSAAPNFGYEFAARRVTDEEVRSLDLSSLRVTFNGAEPVSPETLERFQRRFTPCGLRPEAMMPVYGLAEAGVGLTFPAVGRAPVVDHIDRALLARSGEARPVPMSATSAASFVCCGRPLPGYQLRVVDEQGSEVAERMEGNLQFTGPSATSGYYRNVAATANLLSGDWRNTGDRGYLARGELYVTGRAKDLIIRRGQHIYPEGIERAVGEIEGIRRGCVAAVGTQEGESGTERLVILAETRESDPERRRELTRRITECVTGAVGEPADEIVLLEPHSILKTSSGKLRRAATRQAFLDGSLGHAAAVPALELLRLKLASLADAVRRALASALRVAFGLYAGCVLLIFAPPVLALTSLVGNRDRAWRLNHKAAKRMLRLLGMPVKVIWEVPPDLKKPHIIVANHASYSDGIVIGAALAEPHRFTAKAELSPAPVLGRYLRGLDTLFIERFAAERLTEVGRIRDALRGGDSVVIFPEGTFVRARGLRAFHLGAFQAAVTAGVPVIPVAICGTRSLLRDGQWLPRRTPLRLIAGAPLAAREDEEPFAAAVRLRDAARTHILRHCEEPDSAS